MHIISVIFGIIGFVKEFYYILRKLGNISMLSLLVGIIFICGFLII